MGAAVAIVALLFIAAAGFIVSGIYMLAGLAWSFVLIGVLLFGAAVYLRAGLKAHGQ